jgi:hypothetical protein
VRRFVAQSFAAMRHNDEAATEAGGIALRYGASNAKAKRELGWELRHPSWREGFVAAYASTAPAERRSPTIAAGHTMSLAAGAHRNG